MRWKRDVNTANVSSGLSIFALYVKRHVQELKLETLRGPLEKVMSAATVEALGATQMPVQHIVLRTQLYSKSV